MIKLNKHNVVNTETGAKARVHYSAFVTTEGRACVTLYGKEYSDKLAPVFGSAENDSDSMSDYFEEDKFRIYEDSPLYAKALEFALAHAARVAARRAA